MGKYMRRKKLDEINKEINRFKSLDIESLSIDAIKTETTGLYTFSCFSYQLGPPCTNNSVSHKISTTSHVLHFLTSQADSNSRTALKTIILPTFKI
jgi:hypothetical protein